jgi:hypothetical protein
MSGHDFEGLVYILIKKMGFIAEQTRQTADGGIDIFAYSKAPIISGKYIIQCKRKNAAISESIVRDLYGVVTAQRANKGVIITNSTFSSASKAFAEDKPIELINGDKLVQLFLNYFKIEATEKEIEIPYYFELFLRELVKEGYKYESRYNQVKKGLVFNKKKIIRERKTYANFVSEKIGELRQFIAVLNNWINDISSIANKNQIDSNEFIKSRIGNFSVLLKGYLDIWKALYYVEPPNELEYIHSGILDLLDTLFNNIIVWLNSINLFLESPELFTDENNITHVPMDLNVNITIESQKIANAMKSIS